MTKLELTIKKIKKDITEYKQSRSIQLDLFDVSDQNQEYSNTVELYDVMPKYFFGGVEREIGKNVEGLPILNREFYHRTKGYKLNILPAAIADKKSGKTIYYYPSQREELVEDVIRKLAITKKSSLFLDEDSAARFSLYEVREELSKIGHGYSLNQIKQAIEICNNSILKITLKGGTEIEAASPIFPFVGRETSNKIKDGKNKYIVMFHPLVTKSINEGTYRLINYEKLMKMKMPLARWLNKRISHLFSQATIDNPYQLKLSTIIQDSGMKEYSQRGDSIRQVSKALEELKKFNIISKFKIQKNLEKNKILDATFIMYVSEEFVSDVKKANKIANLKLREEKIFDITEADLIEIRKEIERNIFGLSKTTINNKISRISTKQEKEEILLALRAAEEFIRKTPDAHPAQITMAAIKDKYLPKSVVIPAKKDEKIVEYSQSTLNIEPPIKDRNKEWQKVKSEMKKEFGAELYKNWLSKLELYRSYEAEIFLSVTTKFSRDWIKREYLPQIEQIWKRQDKGIKKANVICISNQQQND
jgi:hypothetical protein